MNENILLRNSLSEKIFRVAVLLGNHSNPFWTEMKKEYENLASIKSIDVNHFHASSENDRDAQMREFLNILKMPYDTVIINPISRTNLLPGIIKAVTLGLPVIDVGAKTDQELVQQFQPLYIPVRTVDFFHQGFLAGTYICKNLEHMGVSKVAIIAGRPDSAQSIGRIEGAIHAFKSAASYIQIAANESADFDSDKAEKTAQKIMKGYPDIKAFFCANDVMALGVASAVLDHAHSNPVIIVGVDLTEKSREAIRLGLIDASVAFSTGSVAKVIFDILEKIRKNERIMIGNEYNVVSKIVNIENVNSNME
jgi:ABC-type sugar transport system substrate-binding protein